MSLSGSPGIIIKEDDFSAYTQATSSIIGATVGSFLWGPCDEVTLISNEGNFITKFGKPTETNYADWYTVQNYLSYSNAVKVVRAVDATAMNSSDVELETIQIKNSADFLSKLGTLSASEKTARIFAKYPGEYGNFNVVIADKSVLQPTSGNSTSKLAPYVSKIMNDDDVAVGVFIDDALVEYKMCSFVKNSTDINGYSNYIISTINNSSSYIYLIENKLITETAGKRNPVNIDVTLAGGTNGSITDAEYILSWNLFKNSDTQDISYLMQAGASSVVGHHIVTMANTRKDCIACVSPQYDDIFDIDTAITGNIAKTAQSYPESSYMFMDGNMKYIFDAYNNEYRWIPCNSDTAGLLAETDANEAPWFSPGNKSIKNVVKLAWYPDASERDELFKYNVNPICSFADSGTVLYGDWTNVDNSAFNFINVRRCFIYMQKNIAQSARHVMFKQNDEIQRTKFFQSIDPFLRNIQNSRGISDYRIYCDGSVNTADIIDQGIFVAKIAVKPIRSIRWVELTFIATRSDVSFDETIIQG